MPKFKIGMILDNSFPPDPRVENEALVLINNGYDIKLFALSFDKNEKNEETYKGIKVTRHYLDLKLYNKLSPLAYSLPLYHHILKKPVNDFINKNALDALHIHDIPIAGLVFKLNKKYDIPTVLDLHENRPEIMKSYSHISSGIGKYLVDINRWKKKQHEFINKADKIIVVTEEAKIDIIKNDKVNKDKLFVLPNVVNISEFASHKINDDIIKRFTGKYILLYIGATGLRRGVDTAINALTILKNKIPEIKLVIVGKSRDDKFLKKLASDLNVEKYVEFEGWRDHKLLPTYIKASDVCLSPLKRNKHHDTTFANKIFQYMTFGKPVVVSDSTAQANLVKKINSGLVHFAGDHNDLAEKIIYLYNNKEEANVMGEKGKKAVDEKYNWNFSGQELINLYKTIF